MTVIYSEPKGHMEQRLPEQPAAELLGDGEEGGSKYLLPEFVQLFVTFNRSLLLPGLILDSPALRPRNPI